MRPAARIKCSSSERFIHAPPLGGREHARKRGGLTQVRGRFARIGDQSGDFRPGASENLAPLAERARRGISVARDPRCEIAPCRGKKPPVGSDLARTIIKRKPGFLPASGTGAQVCASNVENVRFSWHRSCCMTRVPEL